MKNKGVFWLLLFACTLPLCAGTNGDLFRMPTTAQWASYSDKPAGGVSSAQVVKLHDPSSDLVVEMTGELKPGFMFPFAGITAPFHADRSPVDARQYTGVQFWARGDGRRYVVGVVTAAVKNGNFYSRWFATSDQWTLVQIPFKEMVQMIPYAATVPWTGSDVVGVSFQAITFTGPFSLETKDVALYR